MANPIVTLPVKKETKNLQSCIPEGKAKMWTPRLFQCLHEESCSNKMSWGSGHLCLNSPLYDKPTDAKQPADKPAV